MTITALANDATDVARAGLLETVPAQHVGQALAVTNEETTDEYAIAEHTFACTDPAYPGWYWSVSVVAISGQDSCTVSEINLLPSADALVPPAWKPWAERVEAGDLSAGDLLPTLPTDERLTAGFTGIDEQADDLAPLHPAQWEMGLGREQILSPLGLERAVSRWFDGANSARSAMAKHAPANCSSCGFMVALGGSLGQAFGLCANEFGAADGQIVAMNFGCGAHSSVRPEESSPVPVVDLVIDDVQDEQSDASGLADYVADPEPEEVVESQTAEEIAVDDAPDEYVSEHESDVIYHLDEDADVVQDISSADEEVEDSAPDATTDDDVDADGHDLESL